MTRSEVPSEFLSQPAAAPVASGEPDVFASKPRDHATRKQVEYIRDLLASREVEDPAHRSALEARVTAALAGDWGNGILFNTASNWIPRLKELPRRRPQPGPAPADSRFAFNKPRVEFTEVQLDGDKKPRTVGQIKLPDDRALLAGSYGIDTSDDDRFTNDTSFFKVWANAEYGRGWGIKLYVSDDLSRVSLSHSTQDDLVKAILDAGPEEASRMFGLEFGRCGVCARGLTNDLSRELGIGPVCRGRLAL